jgi:hypothetical protein
LSITSFILMVLVVVAGLGCKARSSSLSEAAQADSVEEDGFNVSALRGYAMQYGVHVNNDETFARLWNIVARYRNGSSHETFAVWSDALGAFAEIMDASGFPSVDAGGEQITFGVVISEWANRRFNEANLCDSNAVCRSAISGLFPLIMAANGMSEEEWRQLENFLQGFEKVVDTLPGSTANMLLEFKVRSLRTRAQFYRAVSFKDARRPFVGAPNWRGQGPTDTDELRAIEARLRELIRLADVELLRSDDPTRINSRMKYGLISDFVLAKVSNTDIAVPLEDPEGEAETFKCSDDESCESLTLQIEPAQREEIQTDIDLIASELTEAHIWNRAALSYLPRLRANQNDIRPWLSGLEETARRWRDWYLSAASQGVDAERPAEIENISPNLAAQMLFVFSRAEIQLPFRHEFRNSLTRFAQGAINYSDFGSDSSVLKSLLELARVVSELVSAYDQGLEEMSSVFDFGNLAQVEKNVAMWFPHDFHSFKDQAIQLMIANENYAEAAEIQQKKLEENKYSAEVDPRFKSALVRRITEDVKMACLNFAVGRQHSKFYNTGMPEQQNGWCFDIYLAKTGITVERSQGLAGSLALEKVCGMRPPLRPPLTLQGINNRILQIDNNGEMTRVCQEQTSRLNMMIGSNVVSVALFPIMGGAGGVVSKWAFARLAQTSAMRVASSGSGAVWNATGGRATAKVVAETLSAYAAGRFAQKATGKVLVAGMESFVSAVMFDIGARAIFAPFGMARFYDPEKNIAGNFREYAESIGTMTLTFMGLRPIHGLSNWVAVRAAGKTMRVHPTNTGLTPAAAFSSPTNASVLRSWSSPHGARNVAALGAVHGIPFAATALYFTQAHSIAHAVQYASDKIAGEIERPPEEEQTFYERFMHSIAMTLSFRLYGHMRARIKNQPQEAAHLMAQARIWRNQRVGPWTKEFTAEFTGYRRPDGTATAAESQQRKNFRNPDVPLDPYRLFGIRMWSPFFRRAWQKDGPEWNRHVEMKFKEYQVKLQRAIQTADTPNQKAVFEAFLENGKMLRDILVNPALRAQLDTKLYGRSSYNAYYKANVDDLETLKGGEYVPIRERRGLPGR